MPMKLILRSDVENLGRLGDIVTVKPGYGRNYLIPQGLAMPATNSNLKVFELERKKLEEQVNAVRSAAQSDADKLNGLRVVLNVRVGEGGKLYGSVTNQMIADELAKTGLEIDRRKVILDETVRALGEYPVRVRLHPDVVAELSLLVLRHNQTVEEFEAEQAAAKEAEEVAAAEAALIEQAEANAAAAETAPAAEEQAGEQADEPEPASE